MSCPDWTALEATRDTDLDAWDSALEHLDDCAACRETAFDSDPLLFLRGFQPEPLQDHEIDEIAAGVATLRRARELEREAPSSRRAAVGPLAAAAAAAIVALLSGVPRTSAPRATATVALAPAPAPLTEISNALAELPILEDVGTDGSLVQVDGADFTLILVERAPPSDV